ncbi:MAG: DUF4230 domain-containing protein, partial [Muribaculaceae bacterium]|nr:DUF4230 domain-containing protein [Muribaculaceae bacterium]
MAVAVCGLLIVSAEGCGSAGSGMSESDSLAEIDARTYTPDFFEEWHLVGKMDFATMTVSKTVTTERTEWYKIGDRIGVYSFDVYLRGYMDLDEMKPSDISVDDSRKTIYVKLPAVKTEISGRSSDLRKEYEDIGIFRSRPDSRERSALKEKGFADFEREFKQNPAYRKQLETVARSKARSYFRSLGEAAGYKV